MTRITWASALALFAVAACGGDAGTGSAENLGAGADRPGTVVSNQAAALPPMSETSESAASAGAASPGAAGSFWGVEEGEAVPILWEDLMPEGALEALEAEYEAFYRALEKRYGANGALDDTFDMIVEGSEMDYMPQLGGFETVPDLEGTLVRIPGYVVPFDFDPGNRQAEFLFAPYMGACIHTPPPPPNQLIYVEASPAVLIDDIYTAYWLEGTLRSVRQDSELASAAYTLQLTKIEPYGTP